MQIFHLVMLELNQVLYYASFPVCIMKDYIALTILFGKKVCGFVHTLSDCQLRSGNSNLRTPKDGVTASLTGLNLQLLAMQRS